VPQEFIPKKILTIAGSDCSGGAGIQADIKTITVHKMYAMSAITSLTAQNTTGVYGIFDAAPEFVAQEIDCIFQDIRPDAVKIGMVSNAAIIETIAAKLKEYKATNIVVDPVMVSTSGNRLLSLEAMDALIHKLLPLASIITPNIPEAEAMTNTVIKTKDDSLCAARQIASGLNSGILIKGGHFTDTADDLLFWQNEVHWFKGEKIANPNTHGTGCTLSSAIACNLADGHPLPIAVKNAKDYITGALKAGLNLGKGSGPLNHMYRIKPQ